MSTLAELNAKVEELSAVVDREQEEIQAAIDALNGVIADLQAQVAEGGTAEERDAIVAKLEEIKADLESTVTPTDDDGEDDGDDEPVE